MQFKNVLNQLLIQHALGLKCEDGAPMQANTVANKLRLLVSLLRKEGLVFTLRDFTGYEGSLGAVLKSHWHDIALEDESFGSKPNREVFTLDDEAAIRKFVNSDDFDWNKHILHAVMYGLGSQFGVRGRQEPHDLTWNRVQFGTYPNNHLDPQLAGRPYAKILPLITKGNQTSLCKWCGSGRWCSCCSLSIL